MTAREVVALNEDVPRLEAAQSGDTYELPRDTNITGDLTLTGHISGDNVAIAGETVAKTIDPGGGGDFLSFAEFQTWFDALNASGAIISVTLADGTYVHNTTIQVREKVRSLSFTGSSAANCTITSSADPLFDVRSTRLSLSKITFTDPTEQNDDLINVFDRGYVVMTSCDTNDWYNVVWASESNVYVWGGTHTNNDTNFYLVSGGYGSIRGVTIDGAGYAGLGVTTLSQARIWDSSVVRNSTTALRIYRGGRLIVESASLSNNTNDYSETEDVINGYGGYIATGSLVTVQTGTITKTVGSGKDFADITALAAWLSSLICIDAEITITIDAGTYTYDQTIEVSSKFKELTLQSAGGTVLINTAADPLFNVTSSKLVLDTIDCNDTIFDTHQCVIAQEHSYVQLSSCDISNFSYGVNGNNSHINVTGCNFTDTWYAIYYQVGCTGTVSTVTIDNAGGYGIYAGHGSEIIARTAVSITSSDVAFGGFFAFGKPHILVTTPTLAGNNTDYGVPLNEVQYYGGFISDGTGALSFKA